MKATLLARTAPSSVRCKDRRISEAATTRHPVCASRRLSEGAKPLFLARIRASEKRRHARNSVRLAMIRAANSTSTYASRPCEMPSSSMMPQQLVNYQPFVDMEFWIGCPPAPSRTIIPVVAR